MKFNHLLSLLVFSFNPLFGQVTNIFPDNGNAGIGTATRVEKLDILGNIFLRNYNNVRGAGAAILLSSYGDSSPGPKIRSFLDYAVGVNSSTIPLLSVRSNFEVVGSYGMIRFGDFSQDAAYQKGAVIYESIATSARGKFHIALENKRCRNNKSVSNT